MTAVAQTVRRAPAKPPEPLRRVATSPAAVTMPRYMMAGAVPIGALHDPEEHQAEKAAHAVAAGGTAHAVLDPGARHDYPKLDSVRRSCGEACQCEDCRKGVRDNATLRRAPNTTTTPAQTPTGAELAAATGGGPMPPTLRTTMENRFGADFGAVRLHTGEGAAQLSSRIGARAFAYGGDVFFGRNQFRPETPEGVHLLAHELTHTIQQGAAPRTTATSTPAPARRSPEPKLQRFSLPSFDPLGYVAEQANMLPGFRMLTLVIGFNPVNMQRVDWSVGNVLRAVIEFMPGGGLITKALDQYGVIDKAANWLSAQIATLGISAESIKTALTRFISSVDITDFASPGDVWERAKRIFNDPIERIKTFARNVADGVVQFVKDAVLRPLAELASQTRAWDLLIAVLGKNPITGDPVPQTPETLIGGFMKLVGQQEIWDNLQKANGVARAMAWFQRSKAALLAFVAELPGVFIATLKSFVIGDLLDLPGALGKIRTGFGDFAGRFFSWAGTAAWDLLEIIFDVVSPGALAYVKKTGAALKSILKNPLPFVMNLVQAAKLGLSNFAGNIGTHLKAGLIDWLTGSLPGVYIPKALSLVELGKFALSVLGITWAQIRAKIVKALGPKGETIMAALETTFDVVVALVRGGPAAAWELIKDKLTNLKDQVVSGIIGFVTDAIVKKAIPKLVAMFIPGAGFISAILSIYDTVMVFVQKLAKIAAVVKSFVDSIVAIAGGQIGGAAARVEGALAGLLSLAISFLAGFVGLGKVSDKIMGVIGKVRGSVDKGLDVAVNWIVGRAKALFARLFGAKDKNEKDERTEEEKTRDKLAAIAEAEKLVPVEDFEPETVRRGLPALKTRYRLQTLELVIDSKTEQTETIHFVASASPPTSGSPKTVKLAAASPVAPGSWIKLTSGGTFEQVTGGASVLKRSAAGTVPISFTTAKPDGSAATHTYAAEHTEWERTNFTHGSKLVMPQGGAQFVLKPAYQDGNTIRTQFYQDTSSSRSGIVSARLPGLAHPTDPKSFLSEAPASLEAAMGYTQRVGGQAVVPKVVASADHDPPISAHWSSKSGNNVNQAVRVGWNGSLGTFKIMSVGANISLGSRGATYTPLVGISFRGPGEP